MNRNNKLLYVAFSALLGLYSCDKAEYINIDVPEPIPATLTIDTNTKYQTVTGFGVMETSWQQTALTDDEVSKLFGKEQGQLSLNILRVRIAPKSKSQNPDDRWGTIVPVVKKAKSLGAKILATPWTPPAELKTNNNIVGGELVDYEGYAEYLKEFLGYMQQNNADIDVLSIQNEPDCEVSYESCFWSGEQQAYFFENFAEGIKEAYPSVKLMTGESFQFRHEATDAVLEDEEACSNLDIVGGHIYGGGNTSYDLAKEKGKEVWMTEYLLNEAWDKSSPFELIGSPRDEALQFINSVNQSMLSDMNAYIYWYGRRYYGMLGDGNAGSEMSKITPRGYLFSLFSKFVTGKTRIKTILSNQKFDKLKNSAYIDNVQNIVLMCINSGDEEIQDLLLNLPFIPSSVKKIYYTVPNEAFPNSSEDFDIISELNIDSGINIEPYTVAVFVFER